MSNQVAEIKNKGAVVSVNKFRNVDVDAGLGETTADDFAIPFIGIVQALSPQRQKNKPEYIPGAEEGMVFNSVTHALYEDGITVIPCYRVRNEIEWVVREEEGGLVDVHPADYHPPHGTARDDRKRDRVLDENGKMTNRQMVTTHSYYVLVKQPNGLLERAVINMSSTQIKKAKRWNTLLANLVEETDDGPVRMPMQAYAFILSATPESNSQGDWYGWTIEKVGLVTEEEYETAVAFMDSVKGGEVRAQYEGEGGGGTPAANVAEDDLPF